MLELNARIKKLRAQIGEIPPLLTVHYADGTQRTMRECDAIAEAITSAISGAEKITGGGKADGRLVDLLNAVIDNPGHAPEITQ